MGRPVLLAENFFNVRLFPSHTLTANEGEAGHEVDLVGSGRRMKSLNYWTPTTTNAAAYISCACDRVRAADMIAIDRGHNLETEVVRLRVSNDSTFASYTEIATVTLPAATYPYSRLSSQPGVRTEEGAWLYRFPQHTGKYWRVVFDAMGSGLRPEIVGLHLGLSFRSDYPEVKPFSHGLRELAYEETRSTSAWVGAGQISQRRTKRLHLKLTDRAEYASARYHIEELVLRGKPTWYVPDDEEAEKAFFARAVPQTAGFQIESDWSEYQGTFDLAEQEPRLV